MRDTRIECHKCFRLVADEHEWFDHECNENEIRIENQLLDVNNEHEGSIIIAGIVATIFWTIILVAAKLLS